MDLLSAPGALLASCAHNFTLIGLFLAVFLLCLDFMKRRRAWSRRPPGPPSRPFIGNLLQLNFHNLPESFSQLRKKYGNVFSLQMGWERLVVVNGYEAVKEALITKSEDTIDRPPMPILTKFGFKDNCEGIVMARYNHGWKDMRRFVLSTLRNFGLGKKSLEEHVRDEASYLCSAIEAEEGHPFDPHLIMNNAVSNIICSIIFGDRFEYGDERFQRLMHLFEHSLKSQSGLLTQVLNVIPVLMNIPWLHTKLLQSRKDILSFIRTIIQEHRDSFDHAVNRDFIDAFLVELEKFKDDPMSTFCEENLLFTTNDLFSAGTETTSTTLRFGLLYMLLHPDVQSRVHKEIDSVIGRDRKPTMEDQANMPFTNAVIHEIQRVADIVPMSVPHMTVRDTEIQGFFIPKGVTIMTNLSSTLKDESMWEKPHQFYPEHFLDADGKFRKRDAFLPFSAGSRVCLGEKLARMELFIFFSNLLQRFTFTIPKGQARPQRDPIYAFLQVPHPFQICAQLR